MRDSRNSDATEQKLHDRFGATPPLLPRKSGAVVLFTSATILR
jgi:hypothetical protein